MTIRVATNMEMLDLTLMMKKRKKETKKKKTVIIRKEKHQAVKMLKRKMKNRKVYLIQETGSAEKIKN
jgi:hypothetical protein